MKSSKHDILHSLTALTLLAPYAGFANTAFDSGVFVGTKIGGQMAMSTWDQVSTLSFFDLAVTDIALFTDGNNHQDSHAFHANLMGNVSVGYAQVHHKYFLAAEISVNLAEEQELNWRENQASSGVIFVSNDTGVNADLATKTTVEIENPDVILDLRPGLLLAKNFLLYGRIGVAFNELSLEQQATTYLNDSAGFSDTISASTSKEESVAGLRVGLGMEYKVSSNLGLSVDYVFTDYGTIENTLNQTDNVYVEGIDPFLNQTIVNSKADVYKSTGTVGVNWYFGGRKQQPMTMDK